MKQNRVVLLGSLFFVVVFFSGCGYTKSELAQMDHSGVQVTASFPDWGGNNSKPEIILTFVNPTAQTRKGFCLVQCLRTPESLLRLTDRLFC